jgi:hypothetical protein
MNASAKSSLQSSLLIRIIVGVKYCFRYNARNRPQRDENGQVIMEMPRQHRRRREKKLMSMDEVNERFPLVKYKAWVTSRADQGLSTAGGVAAPSSRPASVGNMQASDHAEESAVEPVEDATAVGPADEVAEAHKQEKSETSDTQPTAAATARDAETPEPEQNHLHESKTTASTIADHDHEDGDDDDQIQMAVPSEMLANPGDSCAICIDTLEDDDDVRGLTCGHAFHAPCLDPWLTSRRACCPLCKADYYTPKPRPEGEGPNPEEIAMYAHPTMNAAAESEWRARLALPGRGFYQGQEQRRGLSIFPPVGRILRRNQSIAAARATNPAASTSPEIQQDEGTRPRFGPRLPNLGRIGGAFHLPRFASRAAPAAAESDGIALQSPATPRQLEAGIQPAAPPAAHVGPTTTAT